MNLELSTSLQMARVAYTTYGHRAIPIGNRPVTSRLTEVTEISTKRVRCTVGMWRSSTRASVVVAFKGSSNGMEWLNNAHPGEWQRLSPTIAGRVHPGFVNSLNEIWPQAEAAISALTQEHLQELHSGFAAGRSVPLCFTGHSRGGALAILATAHAITSFLLPVHVYTFGAPRAGDSEFAAAYNELLRNANSAHWRFECKGDPIPVFPFVTQATHTGSLVWLVPGAKTVDYLETEPHAARRAVSAVSLRASQFHKMSTYLQVLSQVVSVRTLSGRRRETPSTNVSGKP